MRILAIRAKNLASIPGFDLDLQNGPLARTRIFAITGPTGAGKSTLLDALCLALYDRAPRLEGARDPASAELEVGATDPRSLMRRGAIEALAEVDFLGNDGRSYRATWEVWRARRRTDGKLQSQRMRFARIDRFEDLTGATKTETLARIEAAIGLSFAEFRRAVLLAQGDFAAFLEARPDQRAELLEKMTGTEIYAEISRAAFLRAKAEEETLARLELERSSQRPLAAPERQALEQERAGLAGARGRLDAELAEARRVAAWHAEHERLSREHEEAALRCAESEGAWAEAEADRALLGARAAAEALRPAFEANAAAVRALAEARDRASAAAQAALEAEAQRERTAAVAAEAEAERARAARVLAEARPDLERARALDVRLAEAERELASAQSAAEALAVRLTAARAGVESEAQAKTRDEQRLAEIEAHLRRESDVERLAAQWPRWRGELERLIAAVAERARAEMRLRGLEARAQQERAELAAAEAAFASAEAEARVCAEGASAARRELEAHRAKTPPRAAQEAIERITHELASIESMKVLAAETRRLSRQIAEEERAAKDEKKAAAAGREAAKGLRERKKELEAKVETLRDERDRVETERDLAARRGELLVPGEPCPLCGSQHHPVLDEEPAKDTRHRSVKRRLERAQNELDEVKRELASTEEAAASHAGAAERSAAHVIELQPELERRAREFAQRAEAIELLWVDSPILAGRAVRQVALLLPGSVDARTAAADLDRTGVKLAEHRDELRAALAADEACVKVLEERGDLLELAEARKRERAPAVEAARSHERAAAEEAARARNDVAQIEARIADARAALAQPLAVRAEWEDAAATDAARALPELERLVEAWEKKRAERVELAEGLRARAAALELARAEAARLADDTARAESVRETRAQRATELRAERAGLLGGRDAATMARELEDAAELAEHKVREARLHANESASTAAAAAERSRQAAATRERAELHAAASSARLRDELDASPLAAIDPATLDGPRDAATWPTLAAARLHELAETREHRRVSEPLEQKALPATPPLHELAATKEHRQVALLAALLGIAAAEIAALTRRVGALHDARARDAATLADRRARLDAHRAGALPADAAAARAELARLEAALLAHVDREARVAQALAGDDEILARVRALGPAIDAQRSALARWSELSALIGSADGKKLRTFAQGMTLDLLIEHTNAHLAELRPRYRLQRVAGHDMELAVIDGDMGDELRAIATLSGGETFLVSLALALGLSTLSAKEISIRSLFIDEGFGSLDRDTLEVALATLDRLQAEGRTIGLISHVPDLAERIGYQVQVRPTGPGRSEVVVLEA